MELPFGVAGTVAYLLSAKKRPRGDGAPSRPYSLIRETLRALPMMYLESFIRGGLADSSVMEGKILTRSSCVTGVAFEDRQDLAALDRELDNESATVDTALKQRRWLPFTPAPRGPPARQMHFLNGQLAPPRKQCRSLRRNENE